jgi:hypothetical protein
MLVMVERGELQLADLVGRLRRVEDLKEDDPVDRHHGVVLGDDLLRRHVEDLLHHVHLGADPVHDRNDKVQARRQRPGIAAEALDCVFEALRYRLDAHRHDDEREDEGNNYKNGELADSNTVLEHFQYSSIPSKVEFYGRSICSNY